MRVHVKVIVINANKSLCLHVKIELFSLCWLYEHNSYTTITLKLVCKGTDSIMKQPSIRLFKFLVEC